MKIYLSLEEKGLDKTKEDAAKRYKEETGESGSFQYPDGNLDVDELDFEDGLLKLSGSINSNGENLGYISLDVDLDMDTVIAIIEHYRKKLGKLKTIFEATK